VRWAPSWIPVPTTVSEPVATGYDGRTR